MELILGTKSSPNDHSGNVVQSGPSSSNRKRSYEHINGTDGKWSNVQSCKISNSTKNKQSCIKSNKYVSGIMSTSVEMMVSGATGSCVSNANIGHTIIFCPWQWVNSKVLDAGPCHYFPVTLIQNCTTWTKYAAQKSGESGLNPEERPVEIWKSCWIIAIGYTWLVLMIPATKSKCVIGDK